MHRCCFIPSITLETRAELPGRVASLVRDGEDEQNTRETVAAILASVRREGYPAVRACSERFDGLGFPQDSLAVRPEALQEALDRLRWENPELVRALEAMVGGVRAFAEAQRAALADVSLDLPGGGTVGERWVPLQRVGVYIPGGRAFYPSTLAMTAIPAQVAGVGRIIGVTPPRPEGPDPLVLATAALLGLEELLQVGGAQAVAWLAFGEPQVDLIAGPGNRYVAEAKRQLAGICGIDAVAGPTEVLVVADDTARPDQVAEDLLAQAEHDPDAAAVVVSGSEELLAAVGRELETRVAASPRRAILEASLTRHGRLIRADRQLAIAFAQAWAPEHLELVVAEPEAWLPRLTTAGAVFVGSASAEAFGDYGLGPNHVLPTARTARFTGPLGVATYLKRQSVLRLAPADAAAAAPWVARLAEAEGLVHHAASARLRAHHA